VAVRAVLAAGLRQHLRPLSIGGEVETAQGIEELIGLAKQMNAATRRGWDLGLSDSELAFYDALEVNDSAVAILGDETLRQIARELVEAVRRSVRIDWTLKESVRAQTVLAQAELLCADWAA